MAQKLLNKVGANRKVAAKKAQPVEEKRNVLVGTYGPRQLEKWPGYLYDMLCEERGIKSKV